MHRTRMLLCGLLACAAFGATAIGDAAPASASQSQAVFFEAPSELLNPVTRHRAITQLQWLGVTALRVEMPWQQVAPFPTNAKRPSFDGDDPGAYAWGEYEELLAEAKRLHWKVLLTVSGPAPRWATQSSKPPYVTRPNPQYFEELMTAVSRRFGSEVSMYAIWNEPNQPAFLRPQFDKQGKPVAPRIYRGLFQAGYRGIVAGGVKHPKVLMGEVQPNEKYLSDPKKGMLYDAVSPIAFLRGSLCLNGKFRKSPTCGSLPAYGFALHPYTLAAGPFYRPKNPEDVTIGALGRLVSALNRAGKAHAIKRGMSVFLTEFGVRSKPERFNSVSPNMQAEFDAISERIAWSNPRVASFSQYLLEDDTLKQGPQTGLEYVNGRKKPLYYGFPLPMTVTPTAHGYSLWGYVRPAHKKTVVTISVQPPHAKGYRRLATVHTGASGYWKLSSNVPGQFWRVRWSGPKGAKYLGPPIRAYANPGNEAKLSKSAAAKRASASRAKRRSSRHR